MNTPTTITILNGDPQRNNGYFTSRIIELAEKLSENHQVYLFNLANLNLEYCTGCWSCWWKTPGICAIKDDAEKIFKATINSNLLIFASPLVAGFTSSTLKKVQDRLIVLIHPYLQIINGESHHRKRYDNYPDLGVILGREHDTDVEDFTIVKGIYDRLAINFHCNNRFTVFDDELDSVPEKAFCK